VTGASAFSVTNARRDLIFSWAIPFGIFALTFLAFLPSLWNGFVDWDDPLNLTENPDYRGLGWTQLKWMFGGNNTNFYMPLTWLTYGLDYTLWGMNPAGYHLTSLLLHALNACVFYFVALRLFRAARGGEPVRDSALRAGAALATLLFALHPLRVESVVWATERRDVLSGLFYLLAILAYLHSLEPGAAATPRGRAWYWSAVAAGLCALLSKPMAVSLPVILVLLDIYPLRRLGFGPVSWLALAARRVWLEKVPFILCSAATSVVALLRLGELIDPTALPPVNWLGRLAVSVYALAFYLWKTLVPWNLSALYEQPLPLDPTAWPFVLSALAVAAVTVTAVSLRRRWPSLLTVWLAFVVVLLPVLGIIQIQSMIAADRYTYLASLGWALLAGGILGSAIEAHAAGRLGKRAMALIALVALAPPIGLGGLAWMQTRIWRDSETLWAHTVAVTPSARAHLHWGRTLIREGRPDEAIPHLREALRLRPGYAFARFDLGVALEAQGDLPAAVDEYRAVLHDRPDVANVHYSLGSALHRLGRPAEAIEQYEAALRLEPNFWPAHVNLGVALASQGRLTEAVEHYRQALRANPRIAAAENNLGRALLRLDRPEEATQHFERAVEIDPRIADARNNLGSARAREGKISDAIDQFEAALRLSPAYAEAHSNLGIALMRANRPADAADHFRKALEINPGSAEAHNLLGIALARQGRMREAAGQFRDALRIKPDFDQARANLGQALAEERRR
jgi:tetratricopeptide (TPR) repeat protein